MDNKNYKKAKTLTLIPVVVFLVAAGCLALSSVLAVPTGQGTLYSILALIGILCIALAPLPCLILAIIGTVSASKAVKEGVGEARKFQILGIAEILVYILGLVLAFAMFIIGGQGV